MSMSMSMPNDTRIILMDLDLAQMSGGGWSLGSTRTCRIRQESGAMQRGDTMGTILIIVVVILLLGGGGGYYGYKAPWASYS